MSTLRDKETGQILEGAAEGEGGVESDYPPEIEAEFKRLKAEVAAARAEAHTRSPLAPTCPYCKTRPVPMATTPFMMGEENGARILCVTFFCANPACQKVLAIHVVGPAPQERPLIETPGRGGIIQ